MLVDETKDIDSKIAPLQNELDLLFKERQKILYSYIRKCSHHNITTSENNGRYPWKSSSYVTCIDCGLAVNANGCGPYHTHLVSFKNSRIVSTKPGEKIGFTFFINNELMDALQFPRRFTSNYFKTLTLSIPWTLEQVLEGDKNRYYCLHDKPYDNYKEWYYSTHNTD